MLISKSALRATAVSVVAAVTLGVAGPMASATEAGHARNAEHTAMAAELTAVTQAANAPQIAEAGLDERLGALPQNPTPQQLVEAMYPGDKTAQAAALAGLNSAEQPKGGWSTAWKVTKCVGALGAFVAGNALLVTKAAKFGGVVKGAKLIVQAGNKEERLKLLVATFGEITGISAVATSCG